MKTIKQVSAFYATLILVCGIANRGYSQWTDDGTVVRLTTSTDSVGIGTSSPDKTLHIENAAYNNQLKISRAGQGSYSFTLSGNKLLFLDKDGDQNVAFDASGNVGVGTNSPSAKLDVRGSAIFNEDGGNNDFRIEGDANANLFFADASADAIGIGTTTLKTGYILSVDGKVACEELKVENSTNWPDFVFAPGYSLMSLDDIKSFVRRYGHLPGIPSKEEISVEGISVGRMQASLLQKVEELTLHMISLNDENERLKSEMGSGGAGSMGWYACVILGALTVSAAGRKYLV